MMVLLALLAADPLADAQKAMDELRFDQALVALDAAEHSGAVGPHELADIERMRGQALASMGRGDQAVTAFRRWLALSPDAQLPEGSSPKIVRPFQDAQKVAAPLKVHHEVSGAGVVTLVIDADPLGMIAGARARFRNRVGSEQTVEGRGAGRVPLVLPGGAKLTVELAAIDRYGNRVAEIGGVTLEPSAGAAMPPVVDEHGEPPSIWSRWWLWGGAAVAVAGVGIVFGLQASSAEDDVKRLNVQSTTMPIDFATAKAREDDAHTDALLANLSFGVAGACAVASAILLYREQTTVVATPTRGGAAFSVAVRF